MHEYDLIAEWYASERSDSTGVPEVLALASSLKPGSQILDIGCGNGIPIARALLSAGHQVVGLDSSSEMLVRFRANCPEATALYARVDQNPLPACAFDAAVAWGIIFHLTPEQQKQAIANISQALKQGAPFLFTAGDEDGFEGKPGVMNEVTFLYYSYSTENYRRLLEEQSLSLTDTHLDTSGNRYYSAIRR
jgi:cyclopropane fatty-acyl-phospholipid synthase-like methyltransferase